MEGGGASRRLGGRAGCHVAPALPAQVPPHGPVVAVRRLRSLGPVAAAATNEPRGAQCHVALSGFSSQTPRLGRPRCSDSAPRTF
ncbi:unnamed protein product [Lampetra fluviatilis]